MKIQTHTQTPETRQYSLHVVLKDYFITLCALYVYIHKNARIHTILYDHGVSGIVYRMDIIAHNALDRLRARFFSLFIRL